MLQHSPNIRGVPPVQPGMPVLRGPGTLADRDACHTPVRVQKPQAGAFGLLGGVRARRGLDPLDVPGKVFHWSGMRYGVRAPEQDETPLSLAEVKLAYAKGVL